ncbi:hypothetical protein D1007_51607 [Hordeum vulgare]|nr:hypothetical protein D1007_51607 [Hordeum vulgare]
MWDTWFHDEHDMRRVSYFAGEHDSPRRAGVERRARPPSPPQLRGRTRVRCVTSTPSLSPSPSPPPPPRMTEEEEAWLIQRVMKDSMSMYDEHEWVGLEDALALFAADDVAIPEEQPVAVKQEVHEVPGAFPHELVGQCCT